MIQNFSETEEFIIETEVTPYCNLHCLLCENRNNGGIFSDFKNIDFEYLFLWINEFKKIKSKNIKLILNGGEPTLHPKLSEFCKKIYLTNKNSEYKINIELYTNGTNTKEFYDKLRNLNIKILFTYHSETDINEFCSKLIRDSDVILMLDDDIKKYIKVLKPYNIKIRLFENKKYTDDIIKIYWEYIKTEYLQLKTLSCNKNKICDIRNKYLYIDGNGNICKCIFNDEVLSNIKTMDFSFLNKKYMICKNNFCFYNFGQKVL